MPCHDEGHYILSTSSGIVTITVLATTNETRGDSDKLEHLQLQSPKQLCGYVIYGHRVICTGWPYRFAVDASASKRKQGNQEAHCYGYLPQSLGGCYLAPEKHREVGCC